MEFIKQSPRAGILQTLLDHSIMVIWVQRTSSAYSSKIIYLLLSLQLNTIYTYEMYPTTRAVFHRIQISTVIQPSILANLGSKHGNELKTTICGIV